VHQPNYLPWLGYFQKIYACDVFIFHDAVEFTKRSFTQRTQIRKYLGSNKPIYLTVPLRKHSDFDPIQTLIPNYSTDWQQEHLNKIKNTYRTAPHFNKYYPAIETALMAVAEAQLDFATLNIQLITNILDILKINRVLLKSSEMGFPNALKADKGVAWLVKTVNGQVYLSGLGAKKYQHGSTYEEQNIVLKYSDYGNFLLSDHPTQHQETYLHGLSILDALFNVGASGIIEHFKRFELER
jgi:hypothetical protein